MSRKPSAPSSVVVVSVLDGVDPLTRLSLPILSGLDVGVQ
jgi:hypothetical protein